LKTGGHKGILCAYLLSLPARGAWIEIYSSDLSVSVKYSRSLRGERGLKYHDKKQMSNHLCRSLRGERGLKYGVRHIISCLSRRSLRGERGLKYKVQAVCQ